ncbi:hypothetical protein Vadar_008306 [Vaccinium darrowii]|uniref:Uncharacterized protein n=1 Tax=Vaccinium darrowii TaxID=229202 RepID=A0ACB7X8S4_9ERIC|nr:hypothetical protein Vadar_008306 [Vaccinium darrowii]
MVRAPCCEKMGLKRGPWTIEEDRILINYITAYGHGNWRALPKQAGLLRCGKSCRLRWTNYLRPDIKRGNFSREEEETILELHEKLGNRWSAIAARLPGRTDNEIKNVWHTHLKKKLIKKNQLEITKPPPVLPHSTQNHKHDHQVTAEKEPQVPMNYPNQDSPQHSSGDDAASSATTTCASNGSFHDSFGHEMDENFYGHEMDEDFWADVLSVDISGDFDQFSQLDGVENVCGYNSNMNDGMEYWFNLFSSAGEIPELPGF